MRTFTNYHVLNVKGQLIETFVDDKASAIAKQKQGLKRGWNWTIKATTWEVGDPKDWEMAGCKQDSTKVDWGKNWMLDK